MRVHHINCATFCPIGGFLVSGDINKSPRIICHCLLIETNDGLVLVDTGLGTWQLQNQIAGVGLGVYILYRPRFDYEETALKQIEKLGYTASDVRHIIVTHLDSDHAGALPDFPNAKVHTIKAELDAANNSRDFWSKQRYKLQAWAHNPNWVFHEPVGEKWFGFNAVHQIIGLPPEILIVPLEGHTHGHLGVAIHTDQGWLLHAGDTYFWRSQLSKKPTAPFVLQVWSYLDCIDYSALINNRIRLRELHESNSNIEIVCSHDVNEFEVCCQHSHTF